MRTVVSVLVLQMLLKSSEDFIVIRNILSENCDRFVLRHAIPGAAAASTYRGEQFRLVVAPKLRLRNALGEITQTLPSTSA